MSSGARRTDLPSAASVRHWLDAAIQAPASLPDEGYEALLGADGPLLDELAELADWWRLEHVGDALTYVVNRNLDPGMVGGDDPAARARLAALVAEASALGATEICMQGTPPCGAGYLALVRIVKATAPRLHLHAFRPPELLDGAAREAMTLEEFLAAARAAGLGSVPGTAARILDDTVRARMMGAPDLPVRDWVAIVESAHRAGITSTATMVFGHIETPGQQVAHLRLLAGLQDRTGGFSEFIAMPFVPAAASTAAPGLAGSGVTGPAWREVRAVHAVARLMLHGRIANIQAAWPKVGLEASTALLRGGANDLGGLLLTGRVAPEAGAEAGLSITKADVGRVARQLGRPPRQRTTTYGEVTDGA